MDDRNTVSREDQNSQTLLLLVHYLPRSSRDMRRRRHFLHDLDFEQEICQALEWPSLSPSFHRAQRQAGTALRELFHGLNIFQEGVYM